MTAIESTAAQPATSNINNTTISSSSPKQSISDETGRTPEEFTQLGLWEVEPLYYSLSSSKNGGGGGGYTTSGESGRKKRGKAFKSRAEGEYKCFEAHDGAVYRPGDHVFVEISQTEPYVIGSINMFKMAKRDQLSIKITRYYRPDDVPEISYSLIIQERKEQGHYETTRELQVRELFSSETTTVHPISALRGKCSVKVVKDIRSVAETDLKEPDSFFSCLNFNLESSRLASVQGEIRVGPSHQAKVPQLPSSSISDEPDRDELLYRPGQLCEETEQHYVRMARTFRTFALMKNDRITSLEKNARTGDLVMDDAIVTLHRCGYNTSEAISVMNSSDQLLSTDSSFMSADDVKKFGKGIKTHGKNFFKINREILPYHPREQLVGFYYLWKKSSEATRPKPLARTRAAVANTGKRGGRTGVNATVRNSRPESTELVDYASASETDTEQMEQDGRPNYACHHCYSSKSRDWHHAGKDRQLMCTDCRLFYKKYGQLRPVDRPSTVPPCLFKSARNSPSGSLNGEIEEETGVKTRATKFKERKRTPSVADMLDRTPSKLTDSDGFTPEKRSTPLRNAAKSRKRNNNKTSDENTPAKRRLKTEPTTPEESPAKSEGQPTKQEDVKPSTSAPSSPTVKPSTSPKPLSNGVLPISASAPHLSSKKPIAKVEPLDTSGYNHDEKMQIDEKPSTSTAHSPVEKENQPIKEEILEELDKKQPVDEDDGDFSEAFEKEDQETREISDDRKYSKSTHQYINIENDADAQGREKLKALEKVPGYHLVQTVKFKSVRTCARTYLSYTPEEPEFWKKRKERKEEKKQQQQQQQLNNLNKPQQQQPTQNPVAILPNPNLARPAQVTAPGNLLQKTPTQELPQNADINTTLQAAFMNQLHAQSRIPMSSAQMLPPPGTPIPGFQPMPSMSPFDPRYALGGFPNNQMQMMMMWQQQMEQQKQAEALRHHQLNGMLNGNHAQNTQANAVNANKPNPPTNVVSPMDQQRLAALSLFNQNPSSFQNPLAALAAMQNDQQQQQLAASQALAMLNERAAQQHQQRSIQDRIQMEILQQQQQQQNQAQQQQQNHMQHPTPNQPATAALAAVAQQAQQTQQSQQNQQQQHLLNGSIPQEVLHLLLQQQQHQAQAQAQAAAVQQAQAAAAHQQQQQQQQAQQQAMAALATAMGLGVNPAAMQHNNLMLDMLRNVGQIPGLAAHFNAAAHTPRS